MRLLNLMQCTYLGGMERASLRLMSGLVKRGHQCRVVSVTPLGPLSNLLEAEGIPAIGCSYRGGFGWRSHLRLRHSIRSNPMDVLLMTGPTLSGILAIGGKFPVRKVLSVHFHHTGVKPVWVWRKLYRLAVKRFQCIVFVSDFIRKEAEGLIPELGIISVTIRNPMPMPDLSITESRRLAREALGISPDVPVVGNAGWLIPRKRMDVFLRVASVVHEVYPDAVYLIAGDGPERKALEGLSHSLGIGSAVRWLGWIQDMTCFYKCLDVLLFNSDWDAFPTTPLEAMSYGVPVVASLRNGGLGEVIEKPEHGFLSISHDIDALSAQVLEYIRDPTLARRRGAAGRIRVEEICSEDRCVAAYESVLFGKEYASS